jgi:hypothetical protein
MNCKEVEIRMTDYLERNLPDGQLKLMESHVLQCSSCSLLMNKLQEAYSIIEKEKKVEINPFIYTRIMAKLESIERASLPEYIPVYQRILKPAIIIALLVTGLFIGTLIGGMYSEKDTINSLPAEVTYINDMSMESVGSLASE